MKKLICTMLICAVLCTPAIMLGCSKSNDAENNAVFSTTVIHDVMVNTEKPETSTESFSVDEDINRFFLKSMGEFRITVYTPHSDGGVWGYQTATGKKSKHLQTCAVDPNVIPLGSVIVVNGLTLRCVDVGSAVKGKTVDIFFDGTEKEAIEWAAQFGDYAEVRLQYWNDYSDDIAPIV